MTIPSPDERPDLYDAYDLPAEKKLFSADHVIAITSDEVRRMIEQKHGRPFEEVIRGNFGDAPMTRWSPEKLASTKAYLESLGEFSKSDYYLSVEYIFQRYLPGDDKRTEVEHQRILASKYQKIDSWLGRVERGEPEPEREIKDDPDFAEWLDKTLKGKT